MSEPSSTSIRCVPSAEQTQWFTNEVYTHDSQLKSYVRGSFPAVRDVDDVVQESYLRVWNARAVQPIRSAKAFLFTVARHVALKVLRKNGNAPFVALEDFTGLRIIDDELDAADATCVQEKIELLADAVMALPPRCREIIIQHKLQGLAQSEVAGRLGLSERTVERQVRIGVKRCLAFLQKHGITHFYGDED